MDISISLTPDLIDLINAKVDSGLYTSASDVVCEALRMLEHAEETNSASLRQAWEDGLASGDAGSLDFAALKIEARAALAKALNE
jgi:antitoxin ParD1/3/4